jgi:hypothetical protein
LSVAPGFGVSRRSAANRRLCAAFAKAEEAALLGPISRQRLAQQPLERQLDGLASGTHASQRIPDPINRFLIGSQIQFAARAGQLPYPPFDWLRRGTGVGDIAALRQPTADREKPLWKLQR